MGTISIFAGNFPPRGWMLCQGQILSISQYDALFALLGSTYGGDGQTTFALPDLRGRTPIGQGQGPGLPANQLGQSAGTETVTLLTNQMPAHSHALYASNIAGAAGTPANNVFALGTDSASGTEYPLYETAGGGHMNQMMMQPVGATQPHDNLSPYLATNYIICVEGIFPSHN